MDATGYIYKLDDLDTSSRQDIIEISPEEEQEVINMNRSQRRAWYRANKNLRAQVDALKKVNK